MSKLVNLKEIFERESERVEWKENVADINDIIKTAVAFANDYSNLGGGYIICGAKEIKDENGFQKLLLPGLSSDRFREIENLVLTRCRENVHPPIVPILEELPSDDAKSRVLVFIVPATPDPHLFRSNRSESGIYYVRIGRETREARNGLLRELLVRKKAIEPWDRRICTSATVHDIDLIVLREYLQRMGLWDHQKDIESYLSPDFQLSTFVPSLCGRESLTGTIRPRNFALLLFGRQPSKASIGAHSVFSIYPGIDRSEQIAERKEFDGSIVDQAQKLIEQLNIQSSEVFDKAEGHPNIRKYPVRALHEAVVNALVHRDYELDQPIRITVFTDRIEINSPGRIPSAVDSEKFKKGKASPFWRNQCLAYFFIKLQLAQSEGQGIPTILRIMNDEGCPPPTFQLGEENVLCILPAHPRHEAIRELLKIENAIVLANFEEALEKVARLLNKDPYNFRSIELFCEISSLMKNPELVYDFIVQNNIDISRFSAAAQLMIGEVLTSIKSPGKEILGLANRLLESSASGRLKEDEVKRMAINLRKAKNDEKAIEVIDVFFKSNPNSRLDSSLLDIRAKAKIDLAKRCIDTARNENSGAKIRALAWDKCRNYLEEAEIDLHKALESAKNETQKEFIIRDIEFLETMKSISRKPSNKGQRYSRSNRKR